VSATAGNAQAEVTWSAPSSDGGCAITLYTVTASTGAQLTTNGETSLTFTGLANGTAVRFNVSATNSAGTSTVSAWSGYVTPKTVPGAPLNVAATAGNATATVSWQAPSSNGGSAITGYTVTASPGGAQKTVGNVTSTSMTALTNGTAYTFTVAAINAVGTGADSTPSAAVTPRTVPDAPTAVSATALYQAASVSWSPPAFDGGSVITGYTVTSNPAGGSASTTGATTVTVSGLTNGVSYTFSVKATNVAGTGVASSASNTVVPADTSPASPTNVSASPGSFQATVTWTPPAASPDRSAVVDYTVVASPGGYSKVVTGAATSAATVTGLPSGSYTFTVIARNQAGFGAASSPSSAITIASDPNPPTNVTATSTSSTAATITWSVPAANGVTITGYRIRSAPGSTCRDVSGATTTSTSMSSLTPGKTYVFTVLARTSTSSTCTAPLNDGPLSQPSPELTMPLSAPAGVSGITRVAGDGAVRLSWTGSDRAASYELTANPGAITRTVGGAAVSAVIGGLTNGVAYTLSIRAINSAGSTVTAAGTSTPQAGMVSLQEQLLPGVLRSMDPSLSDDGRYVVWSEGADGAGGSNPWSNSVLLDDRQEQVVYQVGGQGGSITSGTNITAGTLSGDGRYVAFCTGKSLTTQDLNTLSDAYLYDRTTGALSLLSNATDGSQANGPTTAVRLSPDGRYALMASSASNLVSADTNGQLDQFVKDREANTIDRASVYPTGGQMASVNATAFLSDDGRYVFGANSDGGWYRDRVNNTTATVSAPYYDMSGPPVGLSRNGRVLTFRAPTKAVEEAGFPAGTANFTSTYQTDLDDEVDGPVLVSYSDNGVPLKDYTTLAVSADGTLIMLGGGSGSGYPVAIRDVERATTAILDAASSSNRRPGLDGAIAANNRTVVFTYYTVLSSQDREPRALEYLRSGSALGRVWWAGWWQGVNTFAGNYTRRWTDATVATVGPTLQLTRSYNSGDGRDHPFGTGMASSFDASLAWLGEQYLNVNLPDGAVFTFKKPAAGSTFTSPPGVSDTLVSNVDGTYTLTRRDNSTAVFSSTGLLTSLADPQGHALTFTYSGRQLTRVQDSTSGRSLWLTWSAGHVTSVQTDPVASLGGALEWTYAYTDGRLSSACGPVHADGDRCEHYAYTDGLLSEIRNPTNLLTAQMVYGPDGRITHSASDGDHFSQFTYPQPGKTEILDPRQNTTVHRYDNKGRLTSQIAPGNKTSTIGYDSNGWPGTVVAEDGTVTTTVYNAAGDKLTDTTGENAGVAGAAGKSAYLGYDSAHHLTSVRDRRSASAGDDSYNTVLSYDLAHNLTKITSPALPEAPTGLERTMTYSAGTEAAHGGGMTPANLLLTSTEDAGQLTSYRYYSNGDLAEVTNPAGLITRYDYNELGWLTGTTVVSSAYPSGVTTTRGYDTTGRLVRETFPATTDAVSATPHQRQQRWSYNRSGDLVTEIVEDLTGNDLTRQTSYGVDKAGRVTSVTDNQTGQSETRTYDDAGNLASSTDQLGRQTSYTYSARNQLATVVRVNASVSGATAQNITLSSYTYDDLGRVSTETDALGRQHQYRYDTLNRRTMDTLLGFVDPNGAVRDLVLGEDGYDAAGNLTSHISGNGLRTVTTEYDAANRPTRTVLDPTGLNRVTTISYGPKQKTTAVTQGGRTETTTVRYDTLGNPAELDVSTGPGASLTSYLSHDDRGLLVSTVDPRGASSTDPAYRTVLHYDQLGQRVDTVGAAVETVSSTGAVSSTNPTTTYGFNTFGELVRVKDPRDAVTVTSYDRLGRKTRQDLPSYTRPDGTTLSPYQSWTYDHADRLVESRDRLGGLTSRSYDDLDHLLSVTQPAVAGGQPVTTFTVDTAGRVLSSTDPTGALTQLSYDRLDRVSTSTQVIRQPASAPSVLAATTLRYDDLGNVVERTSPEGGSWQASYDVQGNQRSVTDDRGKTWTNSYDVADRLSSTTDPLSRAVRNTYDLAGRLTQSEHLDATSTVLRTVGFGYDAAGNQISATDANGHTTSRGFDAGNRLLTVTQPVSSGVWRTSGFGYDAGSLLTRSTDGRGFTTANPGVRNATADSVDVFYSYTPWGQRKDLTEPSTPGQTDLTDRRWTTSYDAAGRSELETRPGGVTVTRGFDALGRLLTESGSGTGSGGPLGGLLGAGTPLTTVTRTFGYDLGGRLTSFSHPNGTQTLGYDDRGLVTNAAGPAGAMTGGYDKDGRLTSRTDSAGTHTFTYDDDGRLANTVDPLTGATLAYSYDDASTAGTVRSTRTLDRDDLGRVVADTLETPSHAIKAQTLYGYDDNGNVTSREVLTPGTPGLGLHTYGYDWADRLTSWTTPASVTTSYAWDGADNRTSAGSATSTFDARSRITSGPRGSYTWSPRGTLMATTSAGGSTSYGYDALDRLTQSGTTGYSYDALDRIASTTPVGALQPTVFSYAGLGADPSAIGTVSYARDPSGALTSVQDSTAGLTRLVQRDGHGDTTQQVLADGTVTYSAVYDPFGGLTGSTGTTVGAAGFQSDYTETGTGLVHMGARWYDPTSGGFASRDTMTRRDSGSTLVARNGYADANPVSNSDPDGHCALSMTGWGGCHPDANSYQVKVIGGGYADSSRRLIVSPPRPAPKQADGDGAGGCQGEAAELCRLIDVYEHGRSLLAGAGSIVDATLGQPLGDAVSTLRDPSSWGGIAQRAVASYATSVKTNATGCARGSFTSCAFTALDLVDLASTVVPLGGSLRLAVKAAARSTVEATASTASRSTVQSSTRHALTRRTAAADGAAEGGGALRFTQTTASSAFQEGGTMSGRTIGGVANDLRNGAMKPGALPVEVIQRGGNTLIVNTRSALALMRGGIARSDWAISDLTGNAAIEAKITERLAYNGLTDEGTDVLRITGAGQWASWLG